MLAKAAFQRVGQRHTLLAVVFANQRNLVLQPVHAKVLRGDHLRQHIGMQIRRLLDDHRLLRQPVRHHDPADAHPRREDLRKGRGVDHLIFTAQLNRVLIERASNGVSEANFAIGIVFQNDEVIFFRQLNQVTTTRLAQRFAAGVAERRHQINGFDAGGLQQVGQLLHQHPVIIGVDTENIGLRQLKHLQRRQIGRTLNDNSVTWIEQRTSNDIQRLLRAGGDIDLSGRTGHATGVTDFTHRLT